MPLFRRRSPGPGTPTPPWLVPHDPAATAEDVFYCFRLLLGRSPHREEWPGHAARAGEDLRRVVAGYANSLECARRGLFEHDAPGDLATAELDGFRLLASPSDAAVGKHALAGRYEPEVTAAFRRLLRPGMGVVDIGANIGWFTMLSAALVGPEGHVLAVEPNPRNARLLEASRRVNGFGQVTVMQVAAGREAGLLALNTSHSNGTTAALEGGAAAALAAETVPCLPLDALLPPGGRRVHLIKADVEGAEYAALLGCRAAIARDRPVIVSEFSPDLMPGISGISGEGYLRWLAGLGYRLSVVEPDGGLQPAADTPAVMAAYAARGTDHVDVVAEPLQPLPGGVA